MDSNREADQGRETLPQQEWHLRVLAHAFCQPRLALSAYVLGALLVLASLGCRVGPEASGTIQAVLVDSLMLEETDSVFVGRTGGLAVDDRRRILVADAVANALLEFDSTGRFGRRYGAAGRGPGEFRGIGDAILSRADGQLTLTDYSLRRVTTFHRDDGRLLGTRAFDGKLGSLAGADGRIWYGIFDPVNARAVAVEQFAGLVTTDTTPIQASLVAIPKEYLTVESLNGIYGFASVVAWGDTAFVGFAASPFLLLVTADGAVVDTVPLPARTRRGVPPNLAAILSDVSLPLTEMYRAASGLMRLHRRSDGSVVTIHHDTEIAGRLLSARVFAGVIAPDRSRACMDAEIPVSSDAIPWTAMQDDLLFVLDHVVDDDAPRPRLMVRAYRLDTSECSWTPLQGDVPLTGGVKR
ncbi:MAG: 6-bladed beta-propeller [Gemmatimonadaceae bacterium]|nr:6-bladed beta-propeller [Gemmatimonadaceae bacterium]MCW5827669.1 6-bladed beta-propeller [Gemmatimonadaceae bacterium]